MNKEVRRVRSGHVYPVESGEHWLLPHSPDPISSRFQPIARSTSRATFSRCGSRTML